MSKPHDDVAIVAESLGKRFLIGAADQRRTALGALRRALTGRADRRELWALRGLNFEIRRGERVGLIGPNGSGKSTLLLLLARILGPTEGRLEVRGKVDPFFQLGAGLQPRLTVLDNFALCAALLGIPRRTFRRALPRMIEFSELGEYRNAAYGELSSGLAARLPFAVAVHADLDIIVIDEAFSVGDRMFQARCLEVLDDFRRRGKTVVLASHDLDLVKRLCGRALYLRGGRAAFLGPSEEAVARFVADCGAPPAR
jgi:ABC-type polysaccharide/polyol phosphate transport system ATPase subunit